MIKWLEKDVEERLKELHFLSLEGRTQRRV